MLKTLNIEQMPDTPVINFNSDGMLFIKGRSLPENAESFYAIPIEWINAYVESTPDNNTLLTIDLEYFNSSSVKQLLTILLKLEELLDANKGITVRWIYNQEDELMEMKGREMASMVDIPFLMDSYTA